jgi:hypothetical protein
MKNIEKYALLITDTVKEVFVLFLALAILLNYLIQFSNKDLKANTDAQEIANDQENNKQKHFFIGMTWEDVTHYVNQSIITVMRMFMENSSRTSMFYFFYVSCMYLFIQQAAQIKVIDQISWDNIYNDFMNKTIFVVCFPFLLLTFSTLIYVTFDTLVHVLYSTSMSPPGYWNKLFMNILKLLLFLLFLYTFIISIIVFIIYSIIQASNQRIYIEDAHRLSLNDFKNKYAKEEDPETLWYNSRGSDANFYKTMVNTIFVLVGGASESYKKLNQTTNISLNPYAIFNLILLALLIFYMLVISISAGFHKIIMFNLYSTFVLDLSKILTLLMCFNIDMRRIHSLLKIVVAIFILYNIRGLFDYIYFVFGVVVFIIMTFFILVQLNTIKIESCEQFN